LHGLGDYGEMVETLFDEETDDAVGVEDEVAAVGVFVADHGEEGDKLRGLREDVNIVRGDGNGDSGLRLLVVVLVFGADGYGRHDERFWCKVFLERFSDE